MRRRLIGTILLAAAGLLVTASGAGAATISVSRSTGTSTAVQSSTSDQSASVAAPTQTPFNAVSSEAQSTLSWLDTNPLSPTTTTTTTTSNASSNGITQCRLEIYYLDKAADRAQGDVGDYCASTVTKHQVFGDLWEYWTSTKSWHMMYDSRSAEKPGGESVTVFVSAKCRTSQKRRWEVTGRAVGLYDGVWYASGEVYKSATLRCRD